MNIIDLKTYRVTYTNILEYKDGKILLEVENEKDGKGYHCINRFNIENDYLTEIYCEQISDCETDFQYTYIVKEEIIIIKIYDKYKIEVDIIDKITGEIKSRICKETKDEISYIPNLINNRYILFATDVNENSIEYKRYKESSYVHRDNFPYLYDLFENEIYLIKDFRYIDGIGELRMFRHKEEDYLIFNETYMDDYEYEDIYEYIKEGKIERKDIEDIEGLYIISLDSFVNSIKNGEEKIPFELIRKKHIDGWIRYFYTDENYIYYREKDFKTQIEKIIKLGKKDLKSTTVKEINHKDIEGRLVYEENTISSRIYEEKTEGNTLVVKGIYNCDYDISFNFDEHERGNVNFYNIIENRYIIAGGWYEDGDEDEDYYDIYYVMDTKEKKSSKVIGKCEVYGDDLIIY